MTALDPALQRFCTALPDGTWAEFLPDSATESIIVASSGRTIWRLDADNSVHAMPDAPHDISVTVGMRLAPVQASGDLLAFGFGEAWALNPSGAGKWTQLTGAAALPGELRACLASAPTSDPAWGSNLAGEAVNVVSLDSGVTGLLHSKRGRTPLVRWWLYKHGAPSVSVPVTGPPKLVQLEKIKAAFNDAVIAVNAANATMSAALAIGVSPKLDELAPETDAVVSKITTVVDDLNAYAAKATAMIKAMRP